MKPIVLFLVTRDRVVLNCSLAFRQGHGFTSFRYSKELVVPAVYTAIAMRHHAPWTESVDRVVQSLREGGIFQKVLFDPIPLQARQMRELSRIGAQHPLTLGHFHSIFFVQGVMLGVAVILLLAEQRNRKKAGTIIV